MQSLVILGRQPELGLAEVESLFGAAVVSPFGPHAAVVNLESSDINFTRLGGSTRLCEVVTTIPSTNWDTVVKATTPRLFRLIDDLPEGKIRLGLTHIGGGVSPRNLNASGLAIKKAIKAAGHSIRLIPNPSAELNTAQVLHNQLTGPTGIELVFVAHQGKTIIARTVAVQDITAYAARDQKRPKRDARVGMLPPKLAQIITNLAAGTTNPNGHILLDPFCGTGVVLQEAMLMGFTAYGSDLEPRMIEYSKVNLDWLVARPYGTPIKSPNFSLEQADATRHRWQPLNTVACETYLGRPLSAIPAPNILAEIIQDCDTIHRKFLQNLAHQIPHGTRLCIAVPAWKLANGFRHLRTLDSLEELGYNRVRFVHVDATRLIYHRPEQLVARELIVLERI